MHHVLKMQYISLLPKYIKCISWGVFFFTLKFFFLIQFLNDQKAAYEQKINTSYISMQLT